MNSDPGPTPAIILVTDPQIPQGVSPKSVILENRERGAQLVAVSCKNPAVRAVCAPTAAMNVEILREFSLQNELHELNAAAIGIARSAISDKSICVGATIGPCGLELPPEGDDEVETMIDAYRAQIRVLMGAGAEFFLIMNVSLPEARAAVIASDDIGAKQCIVIFDMDDDGKDEDDVDALSALSMFQSMGIAAFGISCRERPEAAVEILEELSPHAQIPLAALVFRGTDKDTISRLSKICPILAMYDVSEMPNNKTNVDFKEVISSEPQLEESDEDDNEDADEPIVAATAREAHFIYPFVDLSEEIRCSENLPEDILEAEDEPFGAYRVVIETEEDVAAFSDNQYMFDRPVCICTDNPELLEAALREYNGRALFDNTYDIDDETLSYFEKRYGLIRL